MAAKRSYGRGYTEGTIPRLSDDMRMPKFQYLLICFFAKFRVSRVVMFLIVDV